MSINTSIVSSQLRTLIDKGETIKGEPFKEEAIEYYQFYNEMRNYLVSNVTDTKIKKQIND